MSDRAATHAPAPRIVRIRVAGAAVAIALAVVMATAPRFAAPLREAWFDFTQRTLPRTISAMPATVVEIDAKSLARLGRWPWPRSLLADLVARVAAHEPAAVGIDILMPKPDPLSPEQWLQRGSFDVGTAREIAALPTNDALLARALAGTRAVLAVAGLPDPSDMQMRATPFVLRGAALDDTGPRLDVQRFPGVLASVDELNRAAAGWGLISADPGKGVIRRIPLVADIDGTLIAAMAIEMFRLALGKASLQLIASGTAVEGIAIGNLFVPTERDGSVRVYFSKRDANRFVSAVDVLDDRIDSKALRQQLVLIAVTGLDLADYHYTPVGERMPGSEIHAQLLENLYEGSLLQRPDWAIASEALTVALLGALLVWIVPLQRPGTTTLIALLAIAVPMAAAFAAFRSQRWLIDAATPAAALALVLTTLLVLTLGESMRHRRALEQVLQRQREEAARMAGELDAARRIQTASLPRAEPLCDERLDLAAAMQPAREVGGDLYDFFRLDDHRVFILVGDVAGKGLSASIFMAVSKALYKSTALRASPPDIGALMAAANEEISRDNPEMLFVTAFAAVLDLETGRVSYCNAGHVNPWLTTLKDGNVQRIVDGDGPPLCAVDDFAYRGGELALRGGDVVVIVSDGVTEAHDASGALYGEARVDEVLARMRLDVQSVRRTVDALLADVAAFAGAAEAADDITVLALRWNGVTRRGDAA